MTCIQCNSEFNRSQGEGRLLCGACWLGIPIEAEASASQVSIECAPAAPALPTLSANLNADLRAALMDVIDAGDPTTFRVTGERGGAWMINDLGEDYANLKRMEFADAVCTRLSEYQNARTTKGEMMNTIEDKLHDRLVANGLFDAQAKEVIARVKAAPENEAMARRWEDQPEDYPPAITALAWMSAKRHRYAKRGRQPLPLAPSFPFDIPRDAGDSTLITRDYSIGSLNGGNWFRLVFWFN